jgi:hypothetical protein
VFHKETTISQPEDDEKDEDEEEDDDSGVRGHTGSQSGRTHSAANKSTPKNGERSRERFHCAAPRLCEKPVQNVQCGACVPLGR